MTGAIHLNKPIARVPKGLVHLNLAHCGLTSKGVNNMAAALSQNKTMHTTLTYLNLSGNNLKDEINVSIYVLFYRPPLYQILLFDVHELMSLEQVLLFLP